MIINVLFSAMLGLFRSILGVMPNLDFASFYGVWENIAGIIRSVCYFLPMGTVAAIWTIIVMLFNIRIAIAFFKALWGVLPIL